MTIDFEQDILRFEMESQERVKKNLRIQLKVHEDFVNRYADPAKADVQTVYVMMRLRLMVKDGEIELTPEKELEGLNNLENWFKDRNVDYPLPERIKEQKEYWEKQIAQKTSTHSTEF